MQSIDGVTESAKVDLSAPGALKMLGAKIKADIDNYCQTAYDDGNRNHLGSSLIGGDCSRYLWYVFRWCHHTKHDGRQYRLFNRGHREEARFIEWLKGIGCTSWNETEDGKQFRISGVMGHYGGSLDGILRLPDSYGVDVLAFLNEFKTSGTGLKFTELQKKGVRIAKPQHWAQMCQYGLKYQMKYGIYMSIDKNNDDLYVEVAELDWNHGTEMEKKAEFIIMSQTPPKKLSESAAFRDCAWCDMRGICHRGEPIDRNCRSCSFAKPVENAEWHCNKHCAIIPKEHIAAGCDSYNAIV